MIGFASDIAEMDELSLRDTDVECLGAGKARIKEEKPLTAVCIAKVPSEWLNVQLMKDNGLVPFLLHKQFGYDSRLVGVNHGDYPYLDTYVRGLKMEFVPTGRDEEKYAYRTRRH